MDVCVYLGSKRGVISGVEPTSKEQSIMFLAGVTSGFLLDLQRAANRHEQMKAAAQTGGNHIYFQLFAMVDVLANWIKLQIPL